MNKQVRCSINKKEETVVWTINVPKCIITQNAEVGFDGSYFQEMGNNK